MRTVELFTVSAHSLEIHRQVFAILGHPDRSHGPQLRLRDVDDRAAHLHEASPQVRHQRREYHQLSRAFKVLYRNVVISNLLETFHASKKANYGVLIFPFAERFLVGSALFGDVALLDGHQPHRGLDAEHQVVHAHVSAEDHQRNWYIMRLLIFIRKKMINNRRF